MVNLKTTHLFIFFYFLIATLTYAQKESIKYELNGRNQADIGQNPFSKFIGEWTLKDDLWTQNWGYGTETIKILNHHTVIKPLNTHNSIIQIIDGPEPNGHIFWSYHPETAEVNHLSSFGERRAGEGIGALNDKGDVTLKLTFADEPENTYRIYNYKWVNADEYHMKSVQYDGNDKPTGLFYEGSFIRIKENDNSSIREEILKHGTTIRQAFLDQDLKTIKRLHHPEVVKALGYNNIQEGRVAVIEGLKETLANYTLEFVKNEVESILMEDNMAIEQTVFSIKGTPKKGGDPFTFNGRTMVTYIRFRESPTGWATIREIIQSEN